ncbi:MAG TPA: LysR family transcriptional regulator [Gammaproteobacteria bacterium]|nr:LysR family transcriptional regulator [Gammaproteobacteria bacterium]
MSKLDQIAAFLAVIEENGFAAAARKQGVSTAAVSRQVSRLEADLKVELIKRTTRQVSLTEIGAQYYEHAKKVLSGLSDAEMAITGSRAEATGILSVTSTRYFAIQYLLPRLSEFMALNPKLRIKLELAERFPDLSQENVDIIFGVSIEGPPDLVRRRVASTRYILCASPAYLKKYGTPKAPHDLAKHRYITHSMRKPDNVVVFEHNKKVYVEPILYLNDTHAMRECALKGMGIVNMHDYMVKEAIKEKRLVELFPKHHEAEQPVYLYYQQSRYLQPKIRRFIDFYTE